MENTTPQTTWLAYTKQDFINRVKLLAEKHDVEITHLDISKKQIYFDCNYFLQLKFTAELNELVEEFKENAPMIFEKTKITKVIRTVHGWVNEEDFLKTIDKKGEE